MKSKKCIKCGNETRDEDSICVLCKKDITKMHKELMDLFVNDEAWTIKDNKIKLRRGYKKSLLSTKR
jgi:hypothetical protein